MGNVTMEATQIHDRTEAGKHQSVAEHLKALDALAQQIEDMPAYTSSDRAWLDEWESKLPELPADPATDGVKVLTATTASGETVKTWEEQESGGGVDYSTTEQDTGIKWIDGKSIYQKTYEVSGTYTLGNDAWTTIITDASIDTLIKVMSINSDGTVSDGRMRWHLDTGAVQAASIALLNLTDPTVTIYYTKVTV